MRRDWHIGLLLVVVTVVVYGQVRTFEFVGLDDPYYVTDNPHIRSGLTWESLRWAFVADLTYNSPYADYWQPVTFLSRLLDVELFGFHPAGHHLMNLLFHALNVVLLFALLRRWTGARWASAFAAAVFAVHPLQVESVAWVTERKDVLSTCLALLTLWCYTGYARRPGAARYILVLAMFALGLMAKAMLVTLPFVMLLLDYWPLGRVQLRAGETRKTLRLIGEKAPLLLLSAGSLAVTLFTSSSQPARELPLSHIPGSYMWYIANILWPTGLCSRSPELNLTIPVWEVAGSVSLLLAFSALAIWQARCRPFLLVGWLWFVGTLVPVVGLNPVADRFTYFPIIGLLICVACVANELAGRWPKLRIALAAVAVAVVGACMVAAWVQTRYWQNNLALFTRAIAASPNNYKALNNLGNTLLWQGRVDEAIARFEEALRIKPDEAPARDNLGSALAKQGRNDEAIAQFELAVQCEPNSYSAHNNWGALLARLGRHDEALAHFREALRLAPDFSDALNSLAWLLATHPDPAIRNAHEAVQLAEKSSQLTGYEDPAVLDTLAAAYAEAGRFDDAIRTAAKAIDEARASADDSLADDVGARLELYRTGKPYRQP